MKILNTHRLIYLLHRYDTAINDAPYMPELYEKAEELRLAIEREVVDEAMQADAMRWEFAKTMEGQVEFITIVRNKGSAALDSGFDAAMALDKS